MLEECRVTRLRDWNRIGDIKGVKLLVKECRKRKCIIYLA